MTIPQWDWRSPGSSEKVSVTARHYFGSRFRNDQTLKPCPKEGAYYCWYTASTAQGWKNHIYSETVSNFFWRHWFINFCNVSLVASKICLQHVTGVFCREQKSKFTTVPKVVANYPILFNGLVAKTQGQACWFRISTFFQSYTLSHTLETTDYPYLLCIYPCFPLFRQLWWRDCLLYHIQRVGSEKAEKQGQNIGKKSLCKT